MCDQAHGTGQAETRVFNPLCGEIEKQPLTGAAHPRVDKCVTSDGKSPRLHVEIISAS